MNCEYTIILFKNKERYKIIKNYKKHKNAVDFFNKKMKESENVVFDVRTENGKKVKYELAIIEKTSDKLFSAFKIDEIGRNVFINLDDPNYSIIKILDYRVPEKVFDIKKNKRVFFDEFLKRYLRGPGLKVVSKLNNKVIVQDDDNFELLSLKSENDSNRFLENLETYLINNNMKNCMVVKDNSIEQKKYLYNILVNKGYDKKMLYRSSTTHLK
jgi:hypothetical protein